MTCVTNFEIVRRILDKITIFQSTFIQEYFRQTDKILKNAFFVICTVYTLIYITYLYTYNIHLVEVVILILQTDTSIKFICKYVNKLNLSQNYIIL